MTLKKQPWFVCQYFPYPRESIVSSCSFNLRGVHTQIVPHSIQLHHSSEPPSSRKYYRSSERGWRKDQRGKFHVSKVHSLPPLYLRGSLESEPKVLEPGSFDLSPFDSLVVFLAEDPEFMVMVNNRNLENGFSKHRAKRTLCSLCHINNFKGSADCSAIAELHFDVPTKVDWEVN